MYVGKHRTRVFPEYVSTSFGEHIHSTLLSCLFRFPQECTCKRKSRTPFLAVCFSSTRLSHFGCKLAEATGPSEARSPDSFSVIFVFDGHHRLSSRGNANVIELGIRSGKHRATAFPESVSTSFGEQRHSTLLSRRHRTTMFPERLGGSFGEHRRSILTSLSASRRKQLGQCK